MINPDIIFDSSKNPDGGNFQIASGYISTTTVLFENENVYAVIHAKGMAELFTLEDELICEASAPAENEGREVYEEVYITVKEDGRMIIGFPVYEWIDNYPNCDGEHDRWDSVIKGYNNISFGIPKLPCKETV